jgi:TolB-like protein/predicted Zn-dependent protease
VAPAQLADQAISDKSVAVLPFVDMSEKHDQEYFSDGLSEELINMLTKVAGLRVPARTSSFYFKGKQAALADLAKALGVSHVLEGSVRKSGNRLRIVAQLIDTRTDAHLWSRTFDRELTDVFAVQNEIAAAVVSQLKITLLGAAPRAKATDPKAYSLYLEGRQYSRQFTREGFERSISLYQQALAIDPQYAAAWDGLAMVFINQAYNNLRPDEEASRLAREAANRAIAIDPDLGTAHGRLGSIASYFDNDFVAAARHFERALALEPTNTSIIGNAAAFAERLGRSDVAIALQKYTNDHDPQNGIGRQNLAAYYICAGKPDEALAELRAALRLNRNRLGAHYFVALALLLQGDPRTALTAILEEGNENERLEGLAMAHYALGQKADSDAALAELINRHANDSVPSVLAFRGEADRAFEWLQRLQTKGYLNCLALTRLRRDPRWLQFQRKIGQAPEQLAAIKFEVKLPN